MLAPLRFLESVRRQVLIRRRVLAGLCAGLAVWSCLIALTRSPPVGVEVVVAAHDVDSGTTLEPDDLERVRFAPGSVPATAIRHPAEAIGRTVLAPLAEGEPLTARRLLGPGGLAGYPGRSAVGLRIPDQDAAALLDPGDRVDLVASDPQSDDDPVLLVRDAVVLALPAPDPDAAQLGTEAGGRLVLFAVPTDGVEHVAAVAAAHFLTIIWNR